MLFRVFFFLFPCLSAHGPTLRATLPIHSESFTRMFSSMFCKSFNTSTIHLAVFVLAASRSFLSYNFLLLFRFLPSPNTFKALYSFAFRKCDDIWHYVFILLYIFLFKLNVRFSVTCLEKKEVFAANVIFCLLVRFYAILAATSSADVMKYPVKIIHERPPNTGYRIAAKRPRA